MELYQEVLFAPAKEFCMKKQQQQQQPPEPVLRGCEEAERDEVGKCELFQHLPALHVESPETHHHRKTEE